MNPSLVALVALIVIIVWISLRPMHDELVMLTQRVMALEHRIKNLCVISKVYSQINSNGDRVSWWELVLLSSRAHPSVATMAGTLL